MTFPEMEAMIGRLAIWRFKHNYATQQIAELMISPAYLAWLEPLTTTPSILAFPCQFLGFMRAPTTPHAFEAGQRLNAALAAWSIGNPFHDENCCPLRSLAGVPLWPENEEQNHGK